MLQQEILGNENLKNEKIVSREIVYLGEFLNSSLLFNARLFHDDVTGYIDTFREPVDPDVGDNVPDGDPTDPDKNTVLVFQNAIDSTTNGLEIELDYRIDPSLRLIVSGAIINISSDTLAPTLSAPQHSYSLLLSKRFNEKYNGSLGYYFVEDFHWMDSNGTGDYKILDMRLSRNFNFSKTHGSLSLVLKNLLDDYSDYKEDPKNSDGTAPQVIQNTVAYIDFRLYF